MKSYDLNTFPEKVLRGEMSQQEAVKTISCFIAENYRVFNLQRFDEDFRSEIIITFLENGLKFINSYNPDIGDFFSFLYSYINSIVTTKLRTLSQRILKDTVTVAEGINNLSETTYQYNEYSYTIGEIPKVPYSYNQTNIEELKKIFEKLRNDNTDKKILVLAMKSSFYISDMQIEKVCKLYNLEKDDFYKTIQYFKETLLSKNEKRIKAEQRRNFAYYHKNRYKLQLERLNNSDNKQKYDYLMVNINNKRDKHERNWRKMNQKLENGFLYLRPTSKDVAAVLGICERQVSYYINCAKKEIENSTEANDLIS